MSELQKFENQINNAASVLLYSLSESSQRQYRHSFEKWLAFAEASNISVWDLRPQNLIAFLEAEPLAHATKSARLAHMRRLLQVLHAQEPDNPQIQSLYEQAKMLKIKRSEKQKQEGRPKNALSPEQVFRALAYWDGETKREIRSKALLAILLYAGLRRSEVVALEWRDVDVANRLIHVRHGKGDKERTIPLLGGETAMSAVKRWQAVCGERRFVFCGIRKGDHLDKDAPMTTDGVYKIIQETSIAIGVDFSPHDARRTLLTNGLAAGSSVADMQFIAGHSNPQTTLGYAQVKDANEVRGRVKLNY